VLPFVCWSSAAELSASTGIVYTVHGFFLLQTHFSRALMSGDYGKRAATLVVGSNSKTISLEVTPTTLAKIIRGATNQ